MEETARLRQILSDNLHHTESPEGVTELVAFIQSEITEAQEQLLDEIYQAWGGDESFKHLAVTVGEEKFLSLIEAKRKEIKEGKV